MLPVAILVATLFFAKEVLGEGDTFHKCKGSDESVSDSDACVSLSSSDSYSSDDVSIDKSYVDEASLLQLCNLLGPIVEEDQKASVRPSDSDLPPNLHDSIVIEVPVGFYRLRRGFLSNSSSFWTQSILQAALRYKEVNTKGWEHTHDGFIGDPHLPEHIQPSDFVGATKQTSYLMSPGRLIGASMAYETTKITAYEENHFALSTTTSTPGVPFGTKFFAKTQIIVVNTGPNRCELICSVEPEFPSGPPLGMKGQISKGMKHGTFETYEKIASHIRNCAVSYGWC